MKACETTTDPIHYVDEVRYMPPPACTPAMASIIANKVKRYDVRKKYHVLKARLFSRRCYWKPVDELVMSFGPEDNIKAVSIRSTLNACEEAKEDF